MSDEVLVKVEGVSKKFCRSLKRSLWYGVQDVSAEVFGRKGSHDELRKNEFWAVNDVSFEIKRGECLGLIGPNGAGKSTLLKMLNGLVKPDQGRITMRGRVGALIELGAGFNPILTARENIYVNGSVLGFTKKEIDRKFDAIVDFAEIEEFIDTPVQNFSSGMKVRLGFAVAAQMEPDVLLIDEVLAVGDLGFRAKSFNTINEISKLSAVILVSHNMVDIARVSSAIGFLSEGQIRYQGPEVPLGISLYNAEASPEYKTRVTGSGKVGLNCITLQAGGVTNPSSIRYLDPLVAYLELSLGQKVEGVVINLSFVDEGMRYVAVASSRILRSAIGSKEASLRVRVDLGRILLSDGKYQIEVSVHDEELREVFIKKTNAHELFVIGDGPVHAPVRLQSNWSIT